MSPDPDDHVQLAERLRVAHAQVAALDLPAAEKASITKRLLAINAASKRSVNRASKRLDDFLEGLETQHLSS
jgi:hypothetical protein